MGLKLNGATSGSIELDVPDNIGSDLSVTLPATAGEIVVANTSGDVDLGGLTVSGSAADDSVNVDSSGRLLVGTSSAPGSSIASTALIQAQGRAGFSSDYSVINARAGYTPSGADAALGFLTFCDNNNNIGAWITAYSDGGGWTSGSNHRSRLMFSTTADGASSPTERMRIDRNGKWYLDNVDLFDPTYIGQIRVNGTGGLLFRNGSTSGRYPLAFQNSAGTFVGSINAGNGSTAYNTSSDYRLKENVVAITDGISRLKQLQPKRFNFIIEAEKTVDGFIAHEVQDIIPEAIHGEKDAVDDEGNPVYQGIDQSKLVPLLTAALQEAIAKIETLEAKVAALEANP
jgi:hypothetical protein